MRVLKGDFKVWDGNTRDCEGNVRYGTEALGTARVRYGMGRQPSGPRG